MSESDLVARTRQLLDDPNVSLLPWFAHFTVHGDPSVVTDPNRPTFSAVATVSKANDDYGRADAVLIAEGVSALPALLADNERLTTELQEDARVMHDSSAAKIALIRRARAAESRADAAEARLAQLTEIEDELGFERTDGRVVRITGRELGALGTADPAVRRRQVWVGPWLPAAASVVSETGETE